ncbi:MULTISPECIES: NADH-ubiquinone oxidoreductase-F iron-sulfur binding region domain-containing protein [unclassified Nocardioides]|uniref:NADH-ubiquinone oxidoreductase-F iron-sulfur binding region domain-containing protein n=1 Tax=unclassified Nocardioides TaxID=2615069 RepID=UPI0009EFC154|nr:MULTISPECIES: NADH-ubiquinone oxidoreductase-F iron-sulfur binding region domain-containing protein [unclassified Nocardioides]GAW49051.1 respiratory-chain NADH dehydrogenase domain-containing protein [Nocardioides sp. PD653-B2]GAW53207.1 respiratory-chain NADH dehydrogenase domain-containing protein [Nocardioides sp. PD653]
MSASPVAASDHPLVRSGPALLEGLDGGRGLTAHRRQYGELPRLGLDDLLATLARVRLRGRGGAAFPFETKLRTAAAGRRPVVVVNLSEGEPASAKDCGLATTRPHLVLDGAVVTARALGARELHVVVPRDRPGVGAAMRVAVGERDDRMRTVVHTADSRFVAGQARAVLELMAGRPNLPVTAWSPEAVAGHRGRPTLLSNAETWAQVGRLVLSGVRSYAALGTAEEPGTTLLTLSGPEPTVVEVELGTPWRDVLPATWADRPVLVGGFHGSWVRWEDLTAGRVSVDAMRAAGTPLGAGALVCPADCPVTFTARVVDYLAGQSARRCGPCLNGLPALATALRAVSDGTGPTDRVESLAALVVGRGACAHPDGTVRLVRSLLATFPAEIAAHGASRCAS